MILQTGGSRDNPGESGCGAVVYDENMKEMASSYKYIGIATNNVAEYNGLVLGIELLDKIGVKTEETTVKADSNLLVKQCKREWKVRDPKLIPIFQSIMTRKFAGFEHVYREYNKRADELGNMAMDKKQYYSSV